MISKTYYDNSILLRGSYRPVAPLNSSPLLFPGGITLADFKSASYTPKEGWRDLVRDQKNATTNRDVSIKDVKIVSDLHVKATGVAQSAPTVRNDWWIRGMPNSLQIPTGISLQHGHIAFDKANDLNLANSQFYAKINQVSSTVSGGVMLGELNRTIRMLRSPFEALWKGHANYLAAVEYKALKANLRGINQKNKARILQDIVSSTWLESVFGWELLAKDIADIAYAIQAVEANRPITQASSKYERGVADSPVYKTARINDFDLRFVRIRKTMYTVYSKCGLVPSTDRLLQDEFGFNYRNFVPTVYNLLPWTFVLDYFSNVGRLIEAAQVVRDDITYTSQSQVTETIDSMHIDSAFTHNPTITKVIYDREHYAKGHYQAVTKDISRRDETPRLELAYRLPSFRQGVNLASLVASSDRSSYKLRGL